MSFTGERPDGAPVKCGAPLSDITAGILAAMGILAAYTHRLKTGQGQWVETSLFEAALVQTYWQSAIALATGVAPTGYGFRPSRSMRPIRPSRRPTSWIVVGGANQKNWLRTLDALGASDLAARSALCQRRRPDGASEGIGGGIVARAFGPSLPHTG